jgi:hypothetical protein
VIGVLSNDSDPDGDAPTLTAVTRPGHGTAVINPDKTITYTPKTSFLGTDTFKYTISDGKGGTATASVTVTVKRLAAAKTRVRRHANHRATGAAHS